MSRSVYHDVRHVVKVLSLRKKYVFCGGKKGVGALNFLIYSLIQNRSMALAGFLTKFPTKPSASFLFLDLQMFF